MRKAKSIFGRGLAFMVLGVLLLSGITVLATTESGRKMLGYSPAVKITLSASVERDKKLVAVDSKTIVNPGEFVNWSLSSVNNGNASADGYKVSGAIPAGTMFVAGSATADAAVNVSYSIDGGKSFAAKPMIDEVQPDGSVKQVPAPVAAYTHVLFTSEMPLEAGAKLNARYRVQVK